MQIAKAVWPILARPHAYRENSDQPTQSRSCAHSKGSDLSVFVQVHAHTAQTQPAHPRLFVNSEDSDKLAHPSTCEHSIYYI